MVTKFAPINVGSLDFDSTKQSLKDYLSNQATFQDYNFDGASINILLDILAANTHYYSIYNSAIANEMFLDSAILRSSVVSNAKTMGYTPRSSMAAMATISIAVTNVFGSYASLVLPRGSAFTTTLDSKNYTFLTDKDYFLVPDVNNAYTNAEVDIYEGTQYTYTYTVNNNPNQRFIIPNNNVDTTQLRVVVQESANSILKSEYSEAKSILDLKSNSQVFFVQETFDGQYEVLFGDDVLGKQPQLNNVIIIEYLVCTPGEAEGADTFTMTQPIVIGATHSVSTIFPAFGSALKEELDSIKIHAKNNFEAQSRSVVPSDYVTNIKTDFPEFRDAIAWGGEENKPPIYGKVFVSILPQNLIKLSKSKKDLIIATIKKRNILNIRPEIIDPNIMQLYLTGTVRYSETLLDIQPNTLKTLSLAALDQYNIDNLVKFGSLFSYSKALSYIDNVNTGVLSSSFTLRLGIDLDLISISEFNADMKFNNPIRPASVSSPAFFIPDPLPNTKYFYEDDGLGILKIYGITNLDPSTKFYVAGDHGEIDYDSGDVQFRSVQITPEVGAYSINIQVEPVSFEVVPAKNQILNLDSSKVNLEVIPS